MKRNTMLKVLNPLLGILLVNQILTGLSQKSLSPETFETFHEWGGMTFAVGAVLHVILNGNWVKANFTRGAAGK